jgi:ATP-dependent helicase HrpA
MRDALKYLEKNIPELQKMAVAYMPLGTQEELREQIVEVALDRAFLLDPLPPTRRDFKQRLEEGRGRLTLIANEVARLARPSWPTTRRRCARSRTPGSSRRRRRCPAAVAAAGAQALPGGDALAAAAAPSAAT